MSGSELEWIWSDDRPEGQVSGFAGEQVNKLFVLMKTAAEGLTASLLTLSKRLCVANRNTCADSAMCSTKPGTTLRCIKAAGSHRCHSSEPPPAQRSTAAKPSQDVRHRHEHDEQGESQHALLFALSSSLTETPPGRAGNIFDLNL